MIVNQWPTDYASVWWHTVERAASEGTSPSDAMAVYVTAQSSIIGDLTDPDAKQIIEDYKAYWRLLERDISTTGGKAPDSGSASVDEGLRLVKFCAQFDPEMREFLTEGDFVDTPPPKSVTATRVDADGAEISAQQAEEWFLNIYGAPCASPRNKTQECDMQTLLESRLVELEPGDYTEVVNVSGSSQAGGEIDRYDITRLTNIWCFKTENFSRTIYEFTEELNLSEKTTYAFNCYFLSDPDGDGDILAFFMGNLLPDGTIGLNPMDNCRLEFGYGFDNLEVSSKCYEAAEQTTEPDW